MKNNFEGAKDIFLVFLVLISIYVVSSKDITYTSKQEIYNEK